MTEAAAQRGHLLGSGSATIFPLEVGQRLRGNSTKALILGISALDTDLSNGHAALGLRDAVAAEAKAGAQSAASCRIWKALAT